MSKETKPGSYLTGPSTTSRTGWSEKAHLSVRQKLGYGAAVLVAVGLIITTPDSRDRESSHKGLELPPIECGGDETIKAGPGETLTDIVEDKVKLGKNVYTQKVVNRIENTNDIEGALTPGATITIPKICTSAG
jgi:hypothetical protein